MHLRGLLALALLLSALAVLGYAYAMGQLRVALFLIFPVFYGSGLLPLVGVLLLVAAAFAGFTAGIPRHEQGTDPPAVEEGPREEPRVRGGGLVMLGPIPIVFGSDRGIVKGLLVLGIALLALGLLFFLLVRAR